MRDLRGQARVMAVWLLPILGLAGACTPPSPAEPPAAPTAVPDRAAGPEAQPLASRIRSELGEDASHYAVVVKALDGSLVVDLQGDRVYYAASLFKLPIMVEAFRQREAGTLAFDDELVVT
ncbi:MAG: serine hydrolase, partial [Chloroflexi bacterium]|nr:serine hydrolase [Chloroflexota bacterium]